MSARRVAGRAPQSTRAVARAAALTLAVAGCAHHTTYVPRAVARGEVTLRYRQSYVAVAGGQQIAHGIGWNGLADYVGCVPESRRHAAAAQSAGRAALGLSIAGTILGAAALGGLAGFIDRKHEWPLLGAGAGAAVVGVSFAASSRWLRNRANGHAIDAINYYNDAVGSVGATCRDPRAPAVAVPPGRAPTGEPPPPPPNDATAPSPTERTAPSAEPTAPSP